MLKTLNILKRKKWAAHQTEDVGTGNQLDMKLEKKRPRESEKINWFQSGYMFSLKQKVTRKAKNKK